MTRERGAGALLLVVIVAAASYLRLRALADPSFWLDEILGYGLTGIAARKPWWAWIIGFDAEHGPLYYATQLATRFIDTPELSARLAPALFGIAAVVVLWFAASRIDAAVAFLAAAILAFSPLHVYYSREARPYALSMLIAAAVTAALLRSARVWPAVVLMAAALYTSATAVPMIAAVAIICAVTGLRDADVRRRDWSIAAVAASFVCASSLLYRGRAPATFGPSFPRLNRAFFVELVRSFSVSGLDHPHGDDRVAFALLILAVIGAVVLVRRNSREGIIVIGMAVLPVAIALAGLSLYRHWYAVRYVCTALAAYVLLVAASVGLVPRGRSIVSAVVALLVCALTFNAAKCEAFGKLDWREIASAIAAHSRENDLVIAAESWSRVSLGFYLERLPHKFRILEITNPVVAETLVAMNRTAWIVSAGYSTTPAVSIWACRYPIVLSSPLESFRLHYAPSVSDFMRTRSKAPERRAFAPTFLRIAVATDDLFIGDGWASPEGSFRWVIGTHGTLIIPEGFAKSRVIRMRALPLSHRSLPTQRMRVSLNGRTVAELNMLDGWHDYAVNTAASDWIDGNNVLAFDFARATVPATLGANLADLRALSAAFETIWIADDGAHEPQAPSERTVRLPALIPQSDAKSRFDVSHLNRSAVEALSARLGFDPVTTWPMLVRGATTLEALASTVATSSACEDDGAFARRAYAMLMQQVPNTYEDASLRSMQRTMSRAGVVAHILRKPEFRQKLTTVAAP